MHTLFQGLRVIDLSSVLAGPSAAMFFAELGAEVIKVENPNSGGDVTRSWKLPVESESSAVGAYFSSVNYKKKYVWCDLKKKEGRDEVLRLIETADIVIANFKEGHAEKFGLDYQSLHSLNPRLIYAHLGGFEWDADRVAYDVVLQAETGFMSMNGTEASGPLKMPVALIDVLAAHQLKEGILCALLLRERTGEGQLVRCSLEGAALASLINQASNYLMCGVVAQRRGSIHPNIAPYGETFTCSDGRNVVLAIGNDNQFAQLCELLGAAELASDIRFRSNPARVKNRDELATEIGRLIMKEASVHWLPLFHLAHIPSAQIRDLAEVLDDPRLKEWIREEMIDGVHTKRITSLAFRLEK